MREDLEVLEKLPGALYNFHPGCHVGIGSEAGIAN
jgi:deoxyribonuclease-4